MGLLSNIIKPAAGIKTPTLLTKDVGTDKKYDVPQSSPLDDLKSELKKLDGKYEFHAKNPYNLPKTQDLTLMAYDGMSREEINEYAKAKLAAEYAAALKNIDGGTERAKNDLTAYKEKLNAAAGETMGAIDEAYKGAAAAASNDALKRGLARSSIIVNKLAELENQKAGAKTGVSAELFKGLAEIDNAIEQSETERLRAVEELDIMNAAKLADEIKLLNEKREKQLDEILKYNNSLKEKQSDYALAYAKTDSALDAAAYGRAADEIKNNLSSQLNAQIQREKYEKTGAALYGVSKKDALKYLKDNETYLTEQLGAAYYRRLAAEQEAR